MRITKAPRRAEPFIVTKEHRRFLEFANAVRKERYIGLCYGPAGVGKTQSARRYAQWQTVEPLLTRWGPRDETDKKVYATLAKSRVLFYTPDVRANFGTLRHQIDELLGRINVCIDQHTGKTTRTLPWEYVELVILDEAERLNTIALDYLRDLFDRNDIGLTLIGMPGIEKRMSRYPQLFSRVGFAHHYRPLLGDELSFVLTRHWQRLGLQLDGADFTDAQAIASIARITGGNFRLLRRLFLQIERVLQVNELTVITDDVVDAALGTVGSLCEGSPRDQRTVALGFYSYASALVRVCHTHGRRPQRATRVQATIGLLPLRRPQRDPLEIEQWSVLKTAKSYSAVG